MASAAICGTMPARASARASATSKSSIACRMECALKSSASGPVVPRLSISRAGMRCSPCDAILYARRAEPRIRRTARRALHVEKYSFPLAAKMDVEPPCIAMARHWLSHQSFAPILGDQRQYGVLIVRGVSGKIDTSRKASQQAPRENGNRQVPRLQYIVRTRHASRLDGLERACPAGIGHQAPKTEERRVNGFRLRVIRMVVLPVRIGLPYFDHGIAQRFAFAIENIAYELDSFALCFGSCDARDSMVTGQANLKIRAHGLRGNRHQIDIIFQREFPRVRAARYRICTREPNRAASSSTRTSRSCAGEPFHPERN